MKVIFTAKACNYILKTIKSYFCLKGKSLLPAGCKEQKTFYRLKQRKVRVSSTFTTSSMYFNDNLDRNAYHIYFKRFFYFFYWYRVSRNSIPSNPGSAQTLDKEFLVSAHLQARRDYLHPVEKTPSKHQNITL